MEANVRALAVHRESLLPYLTPATEPWAREAQRRRWDLQRQAGQIADPALALFLGGKAGDPKFASALAELDQRYPWYAPGRFLKGEYETARALEPRQLEATTLVLTGETGAQVVVEIVAVLVPVSRTRAAIMFVDNQARVVYGQRYVDDYEGSAAVSRLVADMMGTIRAVYQNETAIASARLKAPPQAGRTLKKIQEAVGTKVQSPLPRS
jgi:spermidine synthase